MDPPARAIARNRLGIVSGQAGLLE